MIDIETLIAERRLAHFCSKGLANACVLLLQAKTDVR